MKIALFASVFIFISIGLSDAEAVRQFEGRLVSVFPLGVVDAVRGTQGFDSFQLLVAARRGDDLCSQGIVAGEPGCCST